MTRVEMYTDGACGFKHGGWGVVLIYKGHQKVLGGYLRKTSINRAELIAAIKGLEALKRSCEVVVFSDSTYLITSVNSSRVKTNLDLWRQIHELATKHIVEWCHIKGHSGVYGNEAAHAEAKRWMRRKGQ